MKDNLITIAIRSFEQAQNLADKLGKAGIKAVLDSVGKNHESFGIGMRVRINENDLPKALHVIEHPDKMPEIGESNVTPKRILVPIDFSDYSLRACEIAFNIAEKFAAHEIILLHAYILPNSFVTLSGRRAVASPDKEEKRHFMTTLAGDMQNLQQKIQAKIDAKQLADIKFSTQTVEGIPEETIVNYCIEQQPMLVVMGTRGKNKKEEDLIGSVTAEVIEHATVPVLAIPENSEIKTIDNLKNVLFATNFDDRMLVSLRRMMDMLKSLTFNLLIAHFEVKHDDWNAIKMAGLKDFCQQNYPNVHVECDIVAGDNDALDICDRLVSEKQIDLIVMNTHKRRLFARLFNPSMARKMVFHAHTPILVFNT
ncbi:MAG: universal stress protein [Paludibacteraceae bacterium]